MSKEQEHKQWLEEKHNRGVIINDDNEDWGGCEEKYKEEKTSPREWKTITKKELSVRKNNPYRVTVKLFISKVNHLLDNFKGII